MVHRKPRVLIIDDEQVVCDVLYDELNERGYLCATALNANDALTKLATQAFDIALVDIKLPGMSGMQVLRKIQSNHHNTAPIVITAVNDARTAVEALKLGALDYIVKPFGLDQVNTIIRTVLETKTRLPERRDYKVPICPGDKEDDKQAPEKYFNEMNAIARGVEARYDLVVCYSKIAAHETIDIARQLDIPEKAIQRWAATRARHDSKRNAVIKSSLSKLERSPLAQIIMDFTELHSYMPKPKEYEN